MALSEIVKDAGSLSGSRVRVDALEEGVVLVLPDSGYAVAASERQLFSPTLAVAKNVSFDPASGRVGGASLTDREARPLADMLGRYSETAAVLVSRLFPEYD